MSGFPRLTFQCVDKTQIRALRTPSIYLPDLEIDTYDGGSIPPPYKSPVYTGPEPGAEIENTKILTGACHCGAVRVCLKTRGLEYEDIWENDGEGIGSMVCYTKFTSKVHLTVMFEVMS